jgi:hypothetical protein
MTEEEAREIVERYKALLCFVAGERAVRLCALPVEIHGEYLNVERTWPDDGDGLSLVHGGGHVRDIFPVS